MLKYPSLDASMYVPINYILQVIKKIIHLHQRPVSKKLNDCDNIPINCTVLCRCAEKI